MMLGSCGGLTAVVELRPRAGARQQQRQGYYPALRPGCDWHGNGPCNDPSVICRAKRTAQSFARRVVDAASEPRANWERRYTPLRVVLAPRALLRAREHCHAGVADSILSAALSSGTKLPHDSHLSADVLPLSQISHSLCSSHKCWGGPQGQRNDRDIRARARDHAGQGHGQRGVGHPSALNAGSGGANPAAKSDYPTLTLHRRLVLGKSARTFVIPNVCGNEQMHIQEAQHATKPNGGLQGCGPDIELPRRRVCLSEVSVAGRGRRPLDGVLDDGDVRRSTAHVSYACFVV